jgi:uncharacterized iron-regulated membrane protein
MLSILRTSRIDLAFGYLLPMRLRQVVFWLHLIAGVAAGVVIFVMSATGVALAFEKEIIAWAGCDLRRVAPAKVDAPRLNLDKLLDQLREQRPGERPRHHPGLDANTAVLVSFGRANAFYIDPYSGACAPAPKGSFMQTMIEWHRFLGGNTERRAR